jgi:hypothetical protein
MGAEVIASVTRTISFLTASTATQGIVSRVGLSRQFGPRVGTNNPAARTDHARAEGWHRHIVTEAIDVNHGSVVTEIAADREGSHAVRPHVSERHRGPR